MGDPVTAPARKPWLPRKEGQWKSKATYYLPGTVYEAALNRIRWLFDEFENNVAVSFSGGKDSTVVLNLALIVAKERDLLPLKVFWLDQECEYEATVNYAREIADRPDVDFHWYQVPFRLFNAASNEHQWMNVWGEGEEWVRERESDSIHVNDLGTDRFVELLHRIGDRVAPGGCVLTGVRMEESPTRRAGMVTAATHKWATWGSKKPRNHVLMHPIYDWTYKDVWKAIHDGQWTYNVMYDHMYRHGIKVHMMRVSNYHHETAVHALFFLQEIEPETWDRATRRVAGLSTVGHIGRDDFFVYEVPFMFSGWREYRDYLLEHLPHNDADREAFRKQFEKLDTNAAHRPEYKRGRIAVQSLVSNDVTGTKVNNYLASRGARLDRKRMSRPGLYDTPTTEEATE